VLDPRLLLARSQAAENVCMLSDKQCLCLLHDFFGLVESPPPLKIIIRKLGRCPCDTTEHNYEPLMDLEPWQQAT
jgi:hypothetical protein